jgi:hypothetical protein
MMTAPSIWSKRLEKRLTARADTTTLESVQTIARWVSFNRKHAEEFGIVFHRLMMSSPSASRSWMYWQIIDQILILDNSHASKYDRNENLRVIIAEKVILPCIQDISPDLMTKLIPLLEVWDTVNAFAGPTLMNEINKIISSRNSSLGKIEVSEIVVPPKALSPVNDETMEMNTSIEETMVETNDTPLVEDADIPAIHNSVPLKDDKRISMVDFDFEKQGVPAGTVEAREFLEPCKAVATLQITRDLRSDSIVRLRSLLTSIPKDVRTDMEKYKNEVDTTGEFPELDSEKVEHYSLCLSEEILEMNIEEALENVRSFREIARKLKAAREKLFNLLIKSRCDFGSQQAAQKFYDLEEFNDKLLKRKELILDAMDLDGIEPPKEEEEEAIKEFDTFAWFNPDESNSKRQKIH